MEDPRIISALFIFLKMAYYNVLINTHLLEHKPSTRSYSHPGLFAVLLYS